MDVMHLPVWLYHSLWILGALCTAVGVGLALLARNEAEGSTVEVRRLLWLTRGLGVVLSGLSLIGFGLGGLYEVRWLVWVSIAVGLEELYECAMALAFLTRIERNERAMAEGLDTPDALETRTSYRPVPMWA